MTSPFERAALSNQYDFGDLRWAKEGRSESVRTQFFWEYLEPYSHSWKEKAVLDIGAGTGWLVSRALQSGASRAVGVEPSLNNIAQGRADHPEIELVQSSLEEYDSHGQRFDEILAVMSFPHIADVDGAFKKLRSLANEGGEAIIVVPDYEYFKTPRHDYAIELQPIDENQYAIAVTRPSGTLADIVRKTRVYQQSAESAGFELVEEREMKPTENQIARAPRYASVKEKVLTRLLRFKVSTKESKAL